MKEKHVMTTSKNPLPPEEVIPGQEPQNQQYNGKVEQGSLRVSTGVAGLDEVLYGGLIPKRAHLFRRGPRGGKTTLGPPLFSRGTAPPEHSLFITFLAPSRAPR